MTPAIETGAKLWYADSHYGSYPECVTVLSTDPHSNAVVVQFAAHKIVVRLDCLFGSLAEALRAVAVVTDAGIRNHGLELQRLRRLRERVAAELEAMRKTGEKISVWSHKVEECLDLSLGEDRTVLCTITVNDEGFGLESSDVVPESHVLEFKDARDAGSPARSQQQDEEGSDVR